MQGILKIISYLIIPLPDDRTFQMAFTPVDFAVRIIKNGKVLENSIIQEVVSIQEKSTG